VDDRGNRFWDRFWVVVPFVLGVLVGIYLAGQFPAPTGDCAQLVAAPSTSANFALAVVLVALLVGRVVARSVIGPVAARAFTLAAFGLIVSACGSFFVTTRAEPCPETGVGSPHDAMVRTAPSFIHLSGYTGREAF
jgi:hypothetical protein